MAACPCGAVELEPTIATEDGQVVRCRACGMRFLAILPDAAELEKFYTGYGDYAEPPRLEAAVAARRVQAERMVARLARDGSLGGRFLEVGCAAAALLANVARLAPLDCYGVEVDPVSAAAADKLLPGKIRRGTLADAAFPAAWFRAVYAEEVIEHVPDPASFLEEIRRVLEPRGRLILSTPNFAGLGARLLGAGWKEFAPREHVRMYTPRALRRQLELHGFVDVAVKSFGLRLLGHDRRSRLLLPTTHIAVRATGKILGLVGLGEGLLARARKP